MGRPGCVEPLGDEGYSGRAAQPGRHGAVLAAPATAGGYALTPTQETADPTAHRPAQVSIAVVKPAPKGSPGPAVMPANGGNTATANRPATRDTALLSTGTATGSRALS